jgi:hypothetical protein
MQQSRRPRFPFEVPLANGRCGSNFDMSRFQRDFTLPAQVTAPSGRSAGGGRGDAAVGATDLWDRAAVGVLA